MAALIDQMWVINDSGACFFYRSTSGNDQDANLEAQQDLFSGMFSAILSFHTQLTSTQIQKFEDPDGKFLFFSRGTLIFIVKSKLNTPDKKIKAQVEIIQDSFIKRFQDQIDNFSGNVSDFQCFEEDLDKIFKKISKSEKWGQALEGLKL